MEKAYLTNSNKYTNTFLSLCTKLTINNVIPKDGDKTVPVWSSVFISFTQHVENCSKNVLHSGLIAYNTYYRADLIPVM